ncbi:hypothetical protein [Bosea sp. LjRoot237]|uniref:hypothetical protein n=1 Tax=Bosea sp. LjRoot237 TaxID=3342292 RepID=UPI003ECE0D1B
MRLYQIGEVGTPEDETQVRMGDQPACTRDDIGAASFADLEPGHDIADENEIDGRPRNPMWSEGRAPEQHHMRLRPAPELDLAIEPALCERDLETPVGRPVHIAASPVARETREEELFAPVLIDLAQIEDGGNLPQQPQAIEVTLFGRIVASAVLRSELKVAHDVGDEGADPLRRRPGLLLLDADEKGPLIRKGEERCNCRIESEGQADRDDDENRILAGKAGARP